MWWRVKQIAMLVVLIGLAGCSGKGSSSLSCATGNGATVTISGRVTFDRVHHKSNGSLDYNNITQDPVRGAVVEAVCNSAIATTTTDASGYYTLNVPAGTINMLVRVKAQMLKTGTPAWNFRVIDNTAGSALYTLASSSFNTDTGDFILDLNAASGWGVSSYTSTRAAAPFAILDSVYDAFNKILTENPTTIFPALNVNWSVNNVKYTGVISTGQITTSHFNGEEIFLLGKENSDTDEYDDHVIIHEWGHYFEKKFSRADSIGGVHALGDVLDIRVAFGEGFGNAYSAIATDDPVYTDAKGSQQASGFSLDVESNCAGSPATRRGWYSECSVQSILYDLYDSTNDGADVLSMGFAPLYAVLTNRQKNTHALTSVFSFVHGLKQNNPANALDIDALLAAQYIDTVIDDYGSAQSADYTGSVDALPIYKPITLTAESDVVNVCSSNEFQFQNGYGVTRFIRFTLYTAQPLNIIATYDSGTGNNPEMYLYRNGQLIQPLAFSEMINIEALNIPNAVAGDYVLGLFDRGNYADPGIGRTCYKVSM